MVTAFESDSSQVELPSLVLGGKVSPHRSQSCLQISGETLTTGSGAGDDVFSCARAIVVDTTRPLMDVRAVLRVEERRGV